MKTQKSIATVDGYISAQAPELQPMLHQLRALIRSGVPEVQEGISYMVPYYKYHGMLTAFGVHKGGCSLYSMTKELIQAFPKTPANMKISGSTIHLDPGKPLPITAIKKILRLRAKRNEANAMAKEHAKAQAKLVKATPKTTKK